jgi:hypothetical protein
VTGKSAPDIWSRSGKLFVFCPDNRFDDCFGIRVPMPCTAAVAPADGDRGTTEYVSLIGPLAECNLLAVSSDKTFLAKIAILDVMWVGHWSQPTVNFG